MGKEEKKKMSRQKKRPKENPTNRPKQRRAGFCRGVVKGQPGAVEGDAANGVCAGVRHHRLGPWHWLFLGRRLPHS